MVPPSSPIPYRPAYKEMMRHGAAKRLHNGVKLVLNLYQSYISQVIETLQLEHPQLILATLAYFEPKKYPFKSKMAIFSLLC